MDVGDTAQRMNVLLSADDQAQQKFLYDPLKKLQRSAIWSPKKIAEKWLESRNSRVDVTGGMKDQNMLQF